MTRLTREQNRIVRNRHRKKEEREDETELFVSNLRAGIFRQIAFMQVDPRSLRKDVLLD